MNYFCQTVHFRYLAGFFVRPEYTYIEPCVFWVYQKAIVSQPSFTCSKLTIGTLEKDVKYSQS